MLIGLYTAGGIVKATREFSKSFRKVASGDLTAKLKLKRQDEFGVMADDTNEMIGKIRGLVTDVAGFGRNVSDAAGELSDAAAISMILLRMFRLQCPIWMPESCHR